MNKNIKTITNAVIIIGFAITLVILTIFGIASYAAAQSKADLCKKYAHSSWAYNCCMTHNLNNFEECFNSGSSQKSGSSSSSNKPSAPQPSAPQSSGLYTTSQAEAAYQAYYSCLIKNDNNVDICDNDPTFNKIQNDAQNNYDKCQNACGQDTQCANCDKYKKILNEISQTKADAGFSTGKHPNHNSDSNNKPTLAHDFTEEFKSLAGGLARPFDEIYQKGKPFFTNTIVSDSSGPTNTIFNLQSKGWKKASPITTQVPLSDVQSGDVLSSAMPAGLPLGKMVFAAYDPIKYGKAEITIYDGATTPAILRNTSGPLGNDDVQVPDKKKYDMGFYFRVGTIAQDTEEEIHPFAGAMFEILPWMTFDSPKYIRNLRVIRWNKSQERWDELPVITEPGCDNTRSNCKVYAQSPGTSYFAVVAAKQTSWLTSLIKILLWIAVIGLSILSGIIILIFWLVRRRGKNQIPANKKMSWKRKVVRVGIAAAVGVILIFLTVAGSIFYFANKYKINNTGSTKSIIPAPADSPTKPNDVQSQLNVDLLSSEPYSSKQYGFKITPPKNWMLKDKQLPTSDMVAAFGNSQKEGVGAGAFNDNIIIGQEMTSLDQENYIKSLKDRRMNSLQYYTITSEENVQINGMPAELIGSTYSVKYSDFEDLQLIILKYNQAFVVSGTTLKSGWDNNKDQIRASLMSFSFDQQ